MKQNIIILTFLLAPICHSQSIYHTTGHNNFRKNNELNQTISPETFSPELLNAAIFFATNEIRTKNRLPAIEYHKKLELAATIHSKDMAESDFFGHINPKVKKHREVQDRAKIAGITNPMIAENIIEGFLMIYKSGDSVIPRGEGQFLNPKTRKPLEYHTYISLTDDIIKMWMNSKGHRANILSKKAVQHGCGCALYYMEDFNMMPAVKVTQNFQWNEKIK